MADQVYIPKAGVNHVGNYQVSGIPFVSGAITAPSSSATPLTISFPSVTQRFWVHNTNASYALRVGFSANGVKGTNYYIIDSNTGNNTSIPQEFRVKCDKIFLLSDASGSNVTGVCIMAELTGITGYDLASAYSGSAGIG